MYGNLLLALDPHLQFTLTEEEKLPLMCYTRYQNSSSVRHLICCPKAFTPNTHSGILEVNRRKCQLGNDDPVYL